MGGRYTGVVLVVAIAVSVSGLLEAGQPRVRIELTGGWTEVDPNPEALWIQIYDYSRVEPIVSAGPSFQMSQFLIAVRLGKFEIFLDYEEEPLFETDAMWQSEGISFDLTNGIHTDAQVMAMDVGGSLAFEIGDRFRAVPWVGVTRLEVDQYEEGTSSWGQGQPSYDYDWETAWRLWGLGCGVEGVYDVGSRVSFSLRLLQRWGAGTFSAQLTDERWDYEWPIEPGDEPTGSERGGSGTSGKVTSMMFGGDLGLRVRFAGWGWIEGGWRYRNWGYSSGPGVYDGPFLRLALIF